MKQLAYFILAMILSGCASTTVINSEPSGAVVYINGEKAGVTPYTHTDRKLIYSTNTVQLKKEGYQDLSTKFSRDGSVNFGIVGPIFWPWALDYELSYYYEMVPLKASANVSEVQLPSITQTKTTQDHAQSSQAMPGQPVAPQIYAATPNMLQRTRCAIWHTSSCIDTTPSLSQESQEKYGSSLDHWIMSEITSVSTKPGMHLEVNIPFPFLTSDGDTIYNASANNGKTSGSIKAGAGDQLGIGGLWQFESIPVALLLSYNEQSTDVSPCCFTGSGPFAQFDRRPVETLTYYTGITRFRFGGGLRFIRSSEAWAIINGVTDKITFDNTTGLVAEIGYHVTQHIWVNFRSVSENYHVKNHTTGGITTPWLGSPAISGNHSGVNFNIEF